MRERLSDEGDRQRSAGHDPDRRVGQRPDSLGVDALVQHFRQIILDETDLIDAESHEKLRLPNIILDD